MTLANGRQINVLSEVDIPIKLEGQLKIISVLVVSDLAHQIILGSHFWKAIEMVIDLKMNKYTFFDMSQNTEINAIVSIIVSERSQLNRLLEIMFAQRGSGLGCTDRVEHVIRTQSSPIKQWFYRISPSVQKSADAELNRC